MSSYLHFHLKRKGSEEHDYLFSYSRSNEIYTRFFETGEIPFSYSKPEVFVVVSEELLNRIIDDIASEIHKLKEELKTYYLLSNKVVNGSSGNIHEVARVIIEDEERIREYEIQRAKITMLKEIVQDINLCKQNESYVFEALTANMD